MRTTYRPLTSIILVVGTLVWALILPSIGFAQGQLATSTLTGQVTDPSGAAIPGAFIKIQNVGGGQPYTTVSNDLGYYTISSIRPGTYSLRVTKAGFSAFVVPQVPLEVGRTGTVNVRMAPGKVVETVQVKAAAIQLQTQTSSLSQVIGTHLSAQLPMTLLDVTELVDLIPGVTADLRKGPYGDPAALGQGMGTEDRTDYDINGGQAQTANVYEDGVDMTFSCDMAPCSASSVTPGFVHEMQVFTNNVPAPYGQGAGIVNIITKSGTNSFHGSANEFLQNSALNANDFFANAAGRPEPYQNRNQYGYTVGGPIQKNKMWFFDDFEWLKNIHAQTVATRVPTAAEKAGDFNNEYTTSGQQVTVYNPFQTSIDPTTGLTLRAPFPNNTIPSSLLDPSGFATKLVSYYPAPNNPGIKTASGLPTNQENLYLNASNPEIFDRSDVKIDYDLTSKQRLMGRWSWSKYNILAVPVYGANDPANAEGLSQRTYTEWVNNAVLTWSDSLNPTTVVTLAGNLIRVHWLAPNPSKGFNPTQLGGPFASGTIAALGKQYDGGTAFPYVSISGYGAMGNNQNLDYEYWFPNYGFQANVIKTMGKHTLQVGMEFDDHQVGEDFALGNVGSYHFGGFTAGANPLAPTPLTGNGLADLELNIMGSGGSFTPAFNTFMGSKYFAGFIEDDIHATPKLTLNLGLRYDLSPAFTDRYNNLSMFDQNAFQPLGLSSGPNTGGVSLDQYFINLGEGPLQGAMLFPNSPQNTNGRGVAPTEYTDFAPRLGYAYRLTNKLVARGGFSRLYLLSLHTTSLMFGTGGQGATTPITATINGITPLPGVFSNPFPSGIVQNTYTTQGEFTSIGLPANAPLYNNETPYELQWNQGFQYQLPWNGIASVSYAGAVSRRLTCALYACNDQPLQSDVVKIGPAISNYVPNPFYGIITNPASPLSLPTIQRSQLYMQFPEFDNWENIIPAWQGPNNDAFHGTWNALEASYAKSFSNSIAINVAYTLSKNITNAANFAGTFLAPSTAGYNRGEYSSAYALSPQDVTHDLVAAYVWELPFGKGHRFGSNWNRLADTALGGWQVSNILTFSSGFPIPITETGDTLSGILPNVVPGVNPCLSTSRPLSQKLQEWINPAAFTVTPNYGPYGNASPVMSCRMDGIKNVDMSLAKTFQIHENWKLQFRGEFFNLFNRPQFYAPDSTVGSGFFGLVTSDQNQPRIIQFGLNLSF